MATEWFSSSGRGWNSVAGAGDNHTDHHRVRFCPRCAPRGGAFIRYIPRGELFLYRDGNGNRDNVPPVFSMAAVPWLAWDLLHHCRGDGCALSYLVLFLDP